VSSPLDTIPWEVRREFLTLRKGHGLATAKLANSPQLLALCRCHRGEPGIAEAVIVETIKTLPVPDDRDALLAALAIGTNTPGDLAERRRRFGAPRNREPSTIKLWEDRALAELYQALLRRFASGYNCALLEAYELVIVEDRIKTQAYEERRLLALDDGVDSFSYRIPSHATVTAATPERWEVDLDDGYVKLYIIWFARTLRRGEPYTWKFHVRYPPEPPELSEVQTASQVFGPTTAHYHLDVKFRGERPAACWYFDQQPIELVDAERYLDRERLAPDAEGRVSHEFRYLSGAADSGIAWKWL
jgi:hypothetical protein